MNFIFYLNLIYYHLIASSMGGVNGAHVSSQARRTRKVKVSF